MSVTYIWIIIACTLFVFEMMTGGFALMAFGLGAFVAAAGAAIGMSLEWQIVLFIAISLLFFFFIRPLLVRWWEKRDKNIPQTNAYGLIGRTGKVVEKIDHEARTGRVLVDGDNFMAVSEDGSVIDADSKVEIVALDSTILIVRNIK